MAPVTRSSAPSTPTGPRVSSGTVLPPSVGTRRTPHCTKCHRPRAGHPRSGCPYVGAAEDGLLEELSSLQIVNPTEEKAHISTPRTEKKLRRKLSVRFALVPDQTLDSLSSIDSHLVEQLLQPGMISDNVSPQDKVEHVLKWQKTLDGADVMDDHVGEFTEVKAESSSNNTPTPLSRRMPCTLSTPTASLTVTEPATDQGIGGSGLDMNETVYLLPDPDVKKTMPLSRSMSFEQRSSFLRQLSDSSGTAPATLFSLPLADLDNVQNDAETLGFHVRVLPSREDGKRWVVLGTEEEAIDLLAEKFLKEEERRCTKIGGKSGKLTAVAGGVVFGAVATWTGLAFS